MESNPELPNRLLTGRPYNGEQYDQTQVPGKRRLGKAVGVRSLRPGIPHTDSGAEIAALSEKLKNRLSRLSLWWVPV